MPDNQSVNNLYSIKPCITAPQYNLFDVLASLPHTVHVIAAWSSSDILLQGLSSSQGGEEAISLLPHSTSKAYTAWKWWLYRFFGVFKVIPVHFKQAKYARICILYGK